MNPDLMQIINSLPPELLQKIAAMLMQQGGGQPQADINPQIYAEMAKAGYLDDQLALAKLLMEKEMGLQGDLIGKGDVDARQPMPSWSTSRIANPGEGALWLFERMRGEKQAKEARAASQGLLGNYRAGVEDIIGKGQKSANTIAELMAADLRKRQADEEARKAQAATAETNQRIDQYSGLNNPLSPIAQAAKRARGY